MGYKLKFYCTGDAQDTRTTQYLVPNEGGSPSKALLDNMLQNMFTIFPLEWVEVYLDDKLVRRIQFHNIMPTLPEEVTR